MPLRTTGISLILLAVCVSIGIYFYTAHVFAAYINATITTGIFVPQKPVNLAASIDDRSVTLSWSPPFSDGGSAITDYILEYKLHASSTWDVFSDGVSTSSEVTISSLGNDNEYDFRVYAQNIIGTGSPSVQVSATPGSPAQVSITGITDLTIPTIVAGASITNEGGVSYAYPYTWCVTDSDVNLCGGGNDLVSESGSTLISSGESKNITLPLSLPTTGNYWFHVSVQFGSDTSYASASFNAVEEPGSSGGGGSSSSGGGGNRTRCVGGDINHDKKVNLIDFSIVLSFFNVKYPFSNPCADINADKKVNIIDFSILLSQWGKKPAVFKPIS